MTVTIMKRRGKLATLLCLFGLVCEAGAVRLGSTAKAYKGVATLANTAVQAQELRIDSTLREVDEFLALHRAEIYPSIGKAALNGPAILALKNPRRVGGMMLIGFTEEADIRLEDNGESSPPEFGRYVFYWDQRFLRASLYKRKNFEELVRHQSINVNHVDEFDFPELAKLSKSAPPIIPPPTGAPPVPKPNGVPNPETPDANLEPIPSKASLPVPGSQTENVDGSRSDSSDRKVMIGALITTCLLGSLVLLRLLSRRAKAGQ